MAKVKDDRYGTVLELIPVKKKLIKEFYRKDKPTRNHDFYFLRECDISKGYRWTLLRDDGEILMEEKRSKLKNIVMDYYIEETDDTFAPTISSDLGIYLFELGGNCPKASSNLIHALHEFLEVVNVPKAKINIKF